MMQMSDQQTARATRCLWSLQEHHTDVVGLLLTHIDGLTLTSTLPGSERTERIAAVATAMFLLGEDASDSWGSGDTMEMVVKISPAPDEDTGHYVTMKPIGTQAILVAVCRTKLLTGVLDANLDKAVQYIASVVNGNRETLPRWLT